MDVEQAPLIALTRREIFQSLISVLVESKSNFAVKELSSFCIRFTMFLSIRHEEELECLQSARDVNQLLGVPDFENTNAKNIFLKNKKNIKASIEHFALSNSTN